MKLLKSFTVLALGAALTANAGLFSYSSGNPLWSAAGPVTIPDANLSGWSSTLDLSSQGLPSTIDNISFTVTINGGYNGDLYAYLSHGGALVPLLNRVGVGTGSGAQYSFGFSASGMSVTLADGYANIHGVASPTSGSSYSPDGRYISPLSSAAGFAADGTRTFANQFGNSDPNGVWTLFFADVSGGAQSTLQGWSLDISAVPEPVNIALGLFAGLGLAGVGMRRLLVKKAS